MKKTIALALTLTVMSSLFCSCTLFSKSLDEKSGLTKYLDEVEKNVRNENWSDALSVQERAFKAWRSVMPVLQIDVDHDYVNLIEEYFVALKAYIETGAKSEALATVMLLKDTWDNIGVM